MEELPNGVHSSVMRRSEAPQDAQTCVGYDFNKGIDYAALFASMSNTGFQATHLGAAISTVKEMLNWRLSHEKVLDDATDDEKTPEFRESTKCKIFLGYTSNLVSSGVRETIRFLVEHRMVDVIVTTAGGVEEDFIKCLAPTLLGDFSSSGVELRANGLNRIGNLYVPNDSYCKFEEWVRPILDQLVIEQKEQGTIWSPSTIIARLGKEINHPDSIYYWAQKNGIPVYCPAITDGSFGDMVFFHSYHHQGLIIDIVQDIRGMNNEALRAGIRKTGIIVLGGGLPKHHICNANMMRNGADFSVFINTAQEYDGSDSGARPDEAISWGKLRGDSKPVKVHCDATIAFPLLVAETFAKYHFNQLYGTTMVANGGDHGDTCGGTCAAGFGGADERRGCNPGTTGVRGSDDLVDCVNGDDSHGLPREHKLM